MNVVLFLMYVYKIYIIICSMATQILHLFCLFIRNA